ncbi:sulfite exporter TauE/SafE family protein, partial [Chromobacterium piscinae]
MDLGYTVAGLAVGFIVGLTGVGGGSLMTPILLWFGISPATAVGTDLLYAALTKAGGVVVHHRQRHIDWRITWQLALGSVPAALLTLGLLSWLHVS